MDNTKRRACSRREFMAKAGAAALSATVLPAGLVRGFQANAKIGLGLVGCGGRGVWIAKLFQKHGGYEVTRRRRTTSRTAPTAAGAALGVPESRRFTGLSGYKRLLDAGVDAVAIETPPYFHPEQAAAAVDAGAHVYVAKPVAVDVPGCHSIAKSGAKATAKKRVFLVDFQTRAHPSFIAAVGKVREGRPGRSPLRRGPVPRRIARGRNTTGRSRPIPGTPSSGSRPGASTGPSRAT